MSDSDDYSMSSNDEEVMSDDDDGEVSADALKEEGNAWHLFLL
jgi:hypothetical protein